MWLFGPMPSRLSTHADPLPGMGVGCQVGVKAERWEGQGHPTLHDPPQSQEKKDDIIFWVSMVTEVGWAKWIVDTCPCSIPSTHHVSVW